MANESEELPLLANLQPIDPSQLHNKTKNYQKLLNPYVDNEGIGVWSAMCYMIGLFGVVPIIVIPGAIAYAGPLGFLIVATLICVLAYTSILLSKSWLMLQSFWPEEIKYCRHPYPALAEKAGGISLRKLITFLVNLSIFGASVPFLLLSCEFLQNLMIGWSGGRFHISFCYWMVIVTVCLIPVTWLGAPRNLTWLAWAGAASVVTTSCLCLVGLFQYAPSRVTIPPLIPTWQSFAYAFGSVAFQFDIHSTILTVQVDMHQTHGMPRVLIVSYGAGAVLFGSISLAGFLLFGDSLKHNFLHNFPAGTALLHSIMAVIAVQSLICLILGINPLMRSLEGVMGMPDSFGWRRAVLRTTVMMCILFVSEAVPHFGLAIELVGGLVITPLAFIFPPIFYLLIKKKTSGQKNIKEIILCVAIISFGTVGCVAATVESFRQLAQIQSFAPPCFFNATASLDF